MKIIQSEDDYQVVQCGNCGRTYTIGVDQDFPAHCYCEFEEEE